MTFYLEVNSLVENRGKDAELLGLFNDLAMGHSPEVTHDFTIGGWSAFDQTLLSNCALDLWSARRRKLHSG